MGVVVSLPDRASGGRTKTEKFAFTEQRLEKLRKPETGSRYIFDTKEPGLCVRLTPTSAQYVFYKWYRGQPGRLTIKKVGEVSLKQARDIAAGYRGDLAKGIDVFTRDREEKAWQQPAICLDR